MENNIENHLNFTQSLMEDEKMETLEKINLRRKAIIEWDRAKQQLGEWTEELEKESKEKLERLDNMEQEVKKMAQNEEETEMEKIYLSEIEKDFSINWTSLNECWLEDSKGYYTTNKKEADWIRSLVEAMQLLDNLGEDYNYVSDEDIVEWAEAIKEETEMDWKEFAELQEVQVDQSPSGEGNALFYNDENIVVSVEVNSDHDDTSIWKDKELIQELQRLVKDGYADIYSSVRPSSKSGKEVS